MIGKMAGAGVFDIELHDVETVEVDDSDDAIEIEEVSNR